MPTEFDGWHHLYGRTRQWERFLYKILRNLQVSQCTVHIAINWPCLPWAHWSSRLSYLISQPGRAPCRVQLRKPGTVVEYMRAKDLDFTPTQYPSWRTDTKISACYKGILMEIWSVSEWVAPGLLLQSFLPQQVQYTTVFWDVNCPKVTLADKNHVVTNDVLKCLPWHKSIC